MASKQQLYQHKENLFNIISCLREHGAMTRKELSLKTSLSWGCVSESLTDLIERGLVIEEKASDYQGTGRVPSVIKLSDSFCFLGIDVNEMGLHGCTVGLSGSLLEFYDSTIDNTDEAGICASVIDFVEEILKKQPNILGIGFAMQGIYDASRDCWSFPTTQGRVPLHIRKFLEDKLSLPFHIEHDPCCALLSETRDNGSTRSLLIRLDKGVGASLGQARKLFREGALELGEMVVDPCGTRLCRIVSLKALEENTDLSEEEFMRRAGLTLGRVLGNLCHCFFIDEIILCGEMLKYADSLLPALSEALSSVYPVPPSVRCAAGADAAVGAALLAAEHHIY